MGLERASLFASAHGRLLAKTIGNLVAESPGDALWLAFEVADVDLKGLKNGSASSCLRLRMPKTACGNGVLIRYRSCDH